MRVSWLQFGLGLFQGAFLIFLAPGLIGLLRYLKARMQLRPRPAGYILQPYRDLLKLMRKPAVRSATTSWVFAATPAILFAAYGLLAFMVPVFHPSTLIASDLIVVMYVLGLARFCLSLAGLDAGAPFTGLGSSREMFFHLLTEIGLILFIVAIIIRTGIINLSDIVAAHWQLNLFTEPALILLALSLALLILFECERIPIDNPATHLELTMAHKAITLEYAGRDLALLEWAEMIKLTFLLTVLINLFLPFPAFAGPGRDAGILGQILALAFFGAKIFLLTLILALWELAQPKLRLRTVIRPGLAAMVLSLTAIIYTIALKILEK